IGCDLPMHSRAPAPLTANEEERLLDQRIQVGRCELEPLRSGEIEQTAHYAVRASDRVCDFANHVQRGAIVRKMRLQVLGSHANYSEGILPLVRDTRGEPTD